MRRKHLLLFLFLAIGTLLHAQAPQSVTLQSVLRDASGHLVANQTVSVRLTVTRGSATGLPAYTETHRPTTNPYGLYTVLLGQGSPTLGSFSSIDWGNGPYYLSIEADPAGGVNYSLSVVQPLVSVPYALFADTAAHVAQAVTAGNATQSIYADTAYYTSVADTARFYQERQVLSIGHDTIYLTGGSYVVLPASFSGDYNDLTNQPTIPTVPTNVSAFINDAGYLTSFTEQQVLSIGNDTIYLTGGSYVVLPAERVSSTIQNYVDSIVNANNTTVVNQYIDSVVNANNTTIVNEYIDSVIAVNNTNVVNYYIDSVINANNSTIVNQYIDSVIAANNTTVINHYIDSVINANNSTIVNQYIDSVIAVNNTTVVNHYIDSVINANNTSVVNNIQNQISDSLQNIYSNMRNWVITILRDSTATLREIVLGDMCIPSCESVDSLRRVNDSLSHVIDSIINANPPCAGRTTFGYFNVSACDSYTWNVTGETFTRDTTINTQHSILNSYGCDSIVTLKLTINHCNTTQLAVCDEYTWNVNGHSYHYTSSGTYVDDHDTLVLTVNNPVHDHTDVSACEHYAWTDGNSNDYTMGGTYMHSHTDANGCTQVDTLHLTINNATTGDTSAVACDSYTWDVNGETYTHDTILNSQLSILNSYGCDSTVTLHLTINHGTFNAESQTAETSYSWHGSEYTESGDYTYSYNNTDGCASMDTLHLTLMGGIAAATGTLPGEFSISPTRKVRFSQGNLQYQASTDTWRFAEHQYDYVGESNANRSYSYDGWIDLFAYGTSGWSNGAVCDYPYCLSASNSDYILDDRCNNGLIGDCAESDWAWHNAIVNGGDSPHQWRTLTLQGWHYIIYTRTDAASKNGAAVVNGVSGWILLPDSWTLPSGLTFISGHENGYTTNTYDSTQWNLMEQAGAVFLPAAGIRSGEPGYNEKGYYWVSTRIYRYNNSSSNSYGDCINFRDTIFSLVSMANLYGLSIRPVQESQNDSCAGLETYYTESVTACESYTWSLDGTTYSNPQSYDTFHVIEGANAAGCDSIVILHLYISTTHYTASRTAEFSFVWHDTNYTESGDYTYSYTNYWGCASVDTLHLTITGAINGVLPGIFSVSDTKTVKFSQGNMQYRASTETWRFAEHQYDYVGEGNANISWVYSGWIDLFGWGTSGQPVGRLCCHPYDTSTNSNLYGTSANYMGLTGSYAEGDWAWHNAISNGGNSPHQWRTLTSSEWTYLLNTRTNAASKRGCATVNGIHGWILLPDSWTQPSGLRFTSGSANGYNTNKYNASQWAMMEQAGAVFLPAAGYREGTSLSFVGSECFYWTTTGHTDYSEIISGGTTQRVYHNVAADHAYFSDSGCSCTFTPRSRGYSVRPVLDVQ